MASAGEQMLLGIQLQMNASGVVSGASKAEAALGRVEQKARKTRGAVAASAAGMGSALQEGMGVAAMGAAAMGVGVALEKKFLKPAMNQAKDFQVEMKALGFVTNQAGDELTQYRNKAIEVARETQFTPVQAVAAMRWLRQSGLDNVEMLEALRPALDLATASMGALGLTEAAKLAATTMIKFKHEGRGARELIDAMAHSVRESKLQWEDLPILMNSLRVAPQLMHMTMEEAMTMGGALRNAGASAAESGENINAFVRNLMINERALERYLVRNKISWEKYKQIEAEDLTKGRSFMRIRAMKRLGVELFDTSGKLRSMQDIIKDMLKSLIKLSGESEAKYLRTVASAFDAAAKNVLILLKDLVVQGKTGVEAFDAFSEAIGRNAGAVRQGAAAYETTQRGLEIFIQGSKEGIQVILGQGLLPILWDLSFALRRIVNIFLNYVMISPAFTRALGYLLVLVIGITKAVGSALLAFGAWRMWLYYVVPALSSFGGWLGIITSGFGLLRAAILRTMMVMKPMIGIFAIFWLFSKIWEKIWAKDATGPWKTLQTLLLDIQGNWEAFVDGFMAGFVQAINGILTGVRTIYNLVKEGMVMFAEIFGVEWLKEYLGSVKDAAKVWRVVGTILGVVVAAKVFVLAGQVITATFTMIKFAETSLYAASSVLPVFGKSLRWVGQGFVFMGRAMLVASARMWHIITISIPMMLAGLRLWASILLQVLRLHAVKAIAAFGVFLTQLRFVIIGIWATRTAWLASAAAMLIAIAPYILIAAAIAAIGYAIYKLTQLVMDNKEAIKKWFTGIWDTVTGIDDFFSSMWDQFTTFWSDLAQSAYDAGKGLIESFIQGVKDYFGEMINTVEGYIQQVADYLPGSNAKIGPLSHITDSGRGLVSSFQRGMEEETPAFQRSFTRSLGQTEAVMMGTGGEAAPVSQSKTVSITVENMNFSVEKASPAEVEDLAQKIMARLRELADDDNEVSFA
jgi:TP901 family phage tail tape measure protein